MFQRSFFAVESAFIGPHLGVHGGAFVNYSHNPLVLRRVDGSIPPVGGSVINHRLGVDLVLSLALIDRIEIGLLLPIAANIESDNRLLMQPGGIQSAMVGDLRLGFKALLVGHSFGSGHKLGLGLVLDVAFPTGSTSAFASEGQFSGRGLLVVEWRSSGDRVGIGLDVGALFREDRVVRGLHLSHEFTWGLGARVDATHGVNVIGEVRGRVGLISALHPIEAPAEVMLGLAWMSKVGVEISVAGGAGLTNGYGTPDGRAMLGIRYQSKGRARGQAAPVVKPTETPGDRDGDTVHDLEDSCPDQPGEPLNGGCPPKDMDGDGIDDDMDKCPREKGTMSNFGCPTGDKDGDGIPDNKDRCPDQAGAAANDGCPDVDSDGDGFVDRSDKCPFDMEVWNGVADDDGCPDPGAALVEMEVDRIVLKQPIQFKDAEIDSRSHRTLDVVAKLLDLHPEIKKVRIEGHTDNKGSAIDNLEISKKRAAAVRRYLVEMGLVDAKRLMAQGFGPDRPVADNKSESGRAKNRRIELMIIERGQ